MAAGGDEWNAFVCVSLCPESRSRIALEKQYLFRGSLCFQLVFFISSKRLYDIHVTWFDRFLHRKRARGPLVFRGPYAACIVRGWGNGWGEDPIAGGKRLLLTKQMNKQKPPRRGKTDWLDWTRLGWTGQGRTGQGRTSDDPTYGNEPTRNCKHKEIIKGANDEGNEGKQLGKINQ